VRQFSQHNLIDLIHRYSQKNHIDDFSVFSVSFYVDAAHGHVTGGRVAFKKTTEQLV